MSRWPLSTALTSNLSLALAKFEPGVWYGQNRPAGVDGAAKRWLTAKGHLVRRRDWSGPYNYSAEFMLSAQGIDARSGAAACGRDPKDESPVAESDAPKGGRP